MIRNLLISAIRSLKKNKFFSLLNISGLAIGMAVFLLIAQYVQFEKSYEDFIPGNENIYRVKLEAYDKNELIMATAENYPGVGPALQTELPEVVSYARLYNMGYKNNVVVTYKEARPEPVAIKQHHFLYADSTFLPLMKYEMMKGNAATALAEPNTAVVSEKYASIYFKKQDPVGKTLVMQDDDFNYELATVTGVFKDLPANTHLKFDILFSYKTLYARGDWANERYNQSWEGKDMYTFVELRAGTDPDKMEAKFPSLVDKYKPQLKQSQQKNVLSLQPLKDIHLKSDLAEETEANGSDRIVLFLGMIGIFVLIIAWINYVNLSTARALERAREVGVRKVIGAFKKQLVIQFLVEAALINMVSVILAWGMTAVALPYFNTIAGLSLTNSYLLQPWFLVLLIIVWLGGTFLSGLYPAFVLSSFKPIIVLKGKMKSSSRGIILRKGLVIIQFMASIALIASTFIVYRQLNYMMKRDLGVNIDEVLVVQRPGIADTSKSVFNSSIDHLRHELKKSPAIQSVSTSLTVPGKQRQYKALVKRLGSATNDSAIVRVNSMDYEFLDVFKMKMIVGRNFSPDYPGDENASVILTETASRLLGFKKPEEAIGKKLTVPDFGDDKFIVAGVVNDYHQVSLKKALDPTIFICTLHGGEFYSVRFNGGNSSQIVDFVRQAWTKAFPGNPFEYFFLDDYFNQQYSNEGKFAKLFTTFSILAIIIGCLGLFGLSAYTASQRIKEIGIRKVLGASVPDITKMLSKDFLKLVIIAVVIATPIAWWIMSKWLEDFAYRVNISWWIFVVAGALALMIAMLTVSFQAIKAAIANPIKSLRTE